MNRNEKLLAGGLVAAVVLGIGLPKAIDYWNTPLDQARASLQSAEGQYDKQNGELQKIMQRQRAVKQIANSALPENAERAAILYQRWLTDVAEGVGEFENLRVIPETIVRERKGAYNLIRVRITGQTDSAALFRFLGLLERVDLMHHVVGMSATSNDSKGNPTLDVNCLLEAISLPDAPERSENLFEQHALLVPIPIDTNDPGALDAAALTIPAGSYLRIGPEVMQLVGDGDSPQLRRGAWNTSVTVHPPAEGIEILPLRENTGPARDADLSAILARNLFTRPAKEIPWSPRIRSTGDRRIARGGEMELKFQIEDARDATWDWSASAELPEGIEFQATEEGGAILSWKPAGNTPPAIHALQVTAKSSADHELREDVTITFNSTPALEVEKRIVSPGDTVRRTFMPTDADLPTDSLTLTAENLPEGSSFDPETSSFEWTPGEQLVGKTATVRLTVKDQLGASATVDWQIEVGEDPLRNVRLTFIGSGFGSNPADRTAWLRDVKTGITQKLQEGETLTFPGMTATVEEMTATSVLLSTEEEHLKVQLGQSLRDAAIVEKSATTREPVRAMRPSEIDFGSQTSSGATEQPEKSTKPD